MPSPSVETVETFYILDMDRCLVNTEKLQTLLEQIVERELGIVSDEMNMARREYEREGGSFDTARYVMSVLDGRGLDGPSVWHDIMRMFVAEAQMQDVLEPYAGELLKYLRDEGCRYGIVTYGGDAWQLAKLDAAGLAEIPHLVTHDVEKSRLIRSWQTQDGFLIPRPVGGSVPILARSLVFIDDKPVSFVGLPEEVRGICAIAPGASWPDEILQQLPSNVSVTYGLHGAIELLFNHDYSEVVDKT